MVFTENKCKTMQWNSLPSETHNTQSTSSFKRPKNIHFHSVCNLPLCLFPISVDFYLNASSTVPELVSFSTQFVCVHVHTCTFVCVHVCVCVFTCVCVCMCGVWVYVCVVYVCGVCVCVWCVCVCVCVCVFVCATGSLLPPNSHLHTYRYPGDYWVCSPSWYSCGVWVRHSR